MRGRMVASDAFTSLRKKKGNLPLCFRRSTNSHHHQICVVFSSAVVRVLERETVEPMCCCPADRPAGSSGAPLSTADISWHSTLRASFKIFLRGLWALEDLTTPDLLIKIKVVLSHVWLYLRSNNTPGGRFCKRFLDQLFFSSEQIAEQMFGRILTQKPLSPAFSHKL